MSDPVVPPALLVDRSVNVDAVPVPPIIVGVVTEVEIVGDALAVMVLVVPAANIVPAAAVAGNVLVDQAGVVLAPESSI